MPGALFLVHLEPSVQGISGMLEHLVAGRRQGASSGGLSFAGSDRHRNSRSEPAEFIPGI